MKSGGCLRGDAWCSDYGMPRALKQQCVNVLIELRGNSCAS